MRTLLIAAVLTLATASVACDDDPTLPDDAPVGHTVNQDGVAHMPGLSDPEANCTQCHGQDLMGGSSGEPSCFSCHGREW